MFCVVSLFLYFILYAFTLPEYGRPPDYSWLKTRNMSEYVLVNENTIVLEPANVLCRAEDRLRLLIIVHTAPGNAEQRKTIRETWGRAAKEDLPGVRVIFLLGMPPMSPAREKLQESIAREHEEHGDVLQQDFVDSYANLTVKTTSMLKWLAGSECSTAKFVMKVDDDAFVNPQMLWAALDHAQLHTTTTRAMKEYVKRPFDASNDKEPPSESESIDYLIMGYVMSSVPIRDRSSKWYLPPKFYPLNIFPK